MGSTVLPRNLFGAKTTVVVAAANASILSRAFADYACNGLADGAVFQRAINDLPATGGLVDLSEGTFNCTDLTASGLALKSNLAIVGRGIGITVVNIAGVFVNSVGPWFNLRFKGFEVNGNNLPGNPSSVGIALYGAINCHVEDVWVHNVAGININQGYGFYFQDCTDLWLTRIWASNIAQRDGIQLKGCTNVWIDEPLVDTTGLNGIDIHMSATPVTPTNIHIIHPRINASGFYAIACAGEDITITDPVLTNCNSGISTETDTGNNITRRVTIINPHIYNTTNSALLLGVFAWKMYDVTVIGGNIDTTINPNTDGVVIGGSAAGDATRELFNTRIIGLTVRNCTRHGIICRTIGGAHTANNWTLISNCSMKANGNRGLLIDNSALATGYEVDHCNITDNVTSAVYIYVNAAGNRITNNIVSGAITDANGTNVVKNNTGWTTENTILSPTFAVDGALAIRTVTIPHGLSITPALANISLTVVKNTNVLDWIVSAPFIESVGAADIVVKLYLLQASATPGATAKIACTIV